MNISSFTKPSNRFFSNVLKLITGTVIAQSLGILTMPIVTRLFSPDAFGIAAIFTSMTVMVSVIACLRYELAIMLPESKEEAANVLGVSIGLVLVITFFSIVIVFFWGDHIIHLFHAVGLKRYLWMIPVTIFFQGLFLAMNYWNSRTKHFGRLSVAQIISSVTTQVAKLSAGFAGFVSGGILIGAYVLGIAVSSVTLGGQIWRDDKKVFINNVHWKTVIDGFVRYKKFPVIDTWGALLNSISWQLPVLMLSSFFSISIVGYYTLGLTVIRMPLNIISNALSQVFYQKASNQKNTIGKNGELVEKLMDKLMFIGILPTMVLTLIGEEIFTLVFGERWFEAGRYTQILAPWIFFWFISSPLSALFSVYERQGSALSVHFIIFFTRAMSLYIGGIYENIYLALGLLSITGIFAYSVVAVWNIRLSSASGKKILVNFSKNLVYCFSICIFLYLIKYIFHVNSIIIITSSIIMVSLFYIIFGNKYYMASLKGILNNGK